MALKELEQDGYEIANVPVVMVSAKDEQEAKEKVLQVNSRYGKITESSLNFFAKDCKINLADLNIHLDKINFEFKEKNDAINETKKMIFAPPPPAIEQSATQDESLSFGGNYEPIDAGNGVNDSSIEQTWVNEQNAGEIEVPSFAEESEFSSEQVTQEQSQFVPQETSEDFSFGQNQFDNTVQNTPQATEPTKQFTGVSFMCPFCYSEFTLSKEQVREILGDE